MTTDLDDRLSALFDDLADRVPVEPRPPLNMRPSMSQPRRRALVVARRLTLQAAALALVAGGSLALINTTRNREAGPATAPPSTDTTVTSPAAPASLFDAPAERIEWSVLSPDSTIAQAQISSIGAGPGGFVAVGVGFDGDLTAGQGRVWFSPDGEDWAESDRELFGPQQVYTVAATSDAYYLYASPAPPTEGSPAEPAQLYRSGNGTDWEPVGAPLSLPGQILAVGDTLVRVGMADGGMVTSRDGVTWKPASFDSDEDVYFDDRIVVSDETAYVRSWTDDGTPGLWSTTDGQTWSAEPTPVTPGRLTGTPAGVVSVGDATEGICNTTVDATADVDAVVAAHWHCPITPMVDLLDTDTTTWQSIAADLPIETPSVPGVTAFGNQLVAAVEGADGTLSVWLSNDGTDWAATDVEVKTVGDGTQPTGSPQGFWVSGQNASTIIVPVRSDGVGGLGQLVIGRIVDTPQN